MTGNLYIYIYLLKVDTSCEFEHLFIDSKKKEMEIKEMKEYHANAVVCHNNRFKKQKGCKYGKRVKIRAL